MLLSRGDYWSSAAGNGPPAQLQPGLPRQHTCGNTHIHTHTVSEREGEKRGAWYFIFHIHTALSLTWLLSIHPYTPPSLSLLHTHTNSNTLHMVLSLCFIYTAYPSLAVLLNRTISLYLFPDLSFQTTAHNHNHLTLSDQKNTQFSTIYQCSCRAVNATYCTVLCVKHTVLYFCVCFGCFHIVSY